jgi:hypothetical protein
LSVRSARVDRGPRPWQHDPQLGEVPEELLAVLVQVLSRHTTSTDGWFCMWDGWGTINGSMTKAIAWAADHAPPSGTPTTFHASAAFPPSVLDGPKVRFPGRNYLLFVGPLDAANELGVEVPWGSFATWERQPPSIWWPQDQAWCAANEIDASFTCIGGPTSLIKELLQHPDLEVIAITPPSN